jgi:hypothetical protein
MYSSAERRIPTPAIHTRSSNFPSMFVRIAFRFLSFAAILAPMAIGAVEPMRIVGTGARIAYTRFTTAGTATAFWQRTPHQLGGPIAELDIGFMNWLHTSKTEMANTNAVTVSHAWVERAATGQILPLAFGGQRQLEMAADSNQAYWLADPIPSSSWTGPAPARDELFWVHAKGSVANSGDYVCQGTPATYPGAKFILFDPANDPGTFDTAGPVPTIAGQNARSDAMPMVFLGRYTGPGHHSVIGIGDSIMTGTGDQSNPAPVVSGYGFFNRAAIDGSGANTIAMMNVSRHGETAKSWVDKHAFRAQLLPFANVAVEEYGTNDIGSDGSSANATVIHGRLESIWADCRAAGIQKILRTRLFPRTASASGNWISLEDQTPNPGWGAGGARDQLHAMFPTALGEGKIDAIVDTLAATCDPGDDHIWFSNGTNDYMTSDGTHLRGPANIAAAAPLRAALLSLDVDAPAETSYLDWSDSIDWNGADSFPQADPNHDTINNLLCYAFNLPPLAQVPTSKLPAFSRDTIGDETWLSFSYRERTDAGDLAYQLMGASDLSDWSPLEVDGITVLREVLDSNPDGDGAIILVRIQVATGSHPDVRFVRLRVSL